MFMIFIFNTILLFWNNKKVKRKQYRTRGIITKKKVPNQMT